MDRWKKKGFWKYSKKEKGKNKKGDGELWWWGECDEGRLRREEKGKGEGVVGWFMRK